MRFILFIAAIFLANAALAATPAPSVVIPEKASPQETFAAEEISGHLGRMLRKMIHIVPENKASTVPVPIFVGNTEFARKWAKELRLAWPAGMEDSLCFQAEGRLCIAGGSGRGTIYGVYDYLESLGVRWLTPDCTVLPRLSAFPLPEKPVHHRMPTSIRYMAWNTPTNALWRVRSRLNGCNANLPERMGGFSREVSRGDCHYLGQLVPYTMFKEHPDWFSMGADGKRNPGSPKWGASHCMSNPEMRAYVVKKLREKLGKNDYREAWIGQSDALKEGCHCPRCAAEREFYMKHASGDFRLTDWKEPENFDPTAARKSQVPWSINNIAFANAVADEIAKTHPQVQLVTLAYTFTTDAPPAPVPRKNVTVNICGPVGEGICCWLHDYRPGTFKILNDWIKLGARVRIYAYGGSNYVFWRPYPNIIGHARTLQNLQRDGVREFFDQGTLGGNGSPMVELRAYLGARMMRDPDTPVMEVIREFCNGYYGAAGPDVVEYIASYDAYTRKHDLHGNHLWGTLRWRKWVNDETVAMGRKIADRAMKSAAGDPILSKRVRRAFMEVEFAEMVLGMPEFFRIGEERLETFFPERAERSRLAAAAFQRAMMENNFNRLGEPALFFGEDSVPAALIRDHRLYRLRDGTNNIAVDPALGGMIVEWRHPALGKQNLIKVARPEMPFNEHYENTREKADPVPWTRRSFQTVKYEKDRLLVLEAKTPLWRIVREYRLAKGKLEQTFRVTNLDTAPRKLEGLYRPVLACEAVRNGVVSIGGTSVRAERIFSRNFSLNGRAEAVWSLPSGAAWKMQIPAGLADAVLYYDNRAYTCFNFNYGSVMLNAGTEIRPGETREWTVTETLEDSRNNVPAKHMTAEKSAVRG